MAATLDEDIAEGLKLTKQDGEWSGTWVLHAKDLEGADAMARLAAAADLLTTDHDSITVEGQILPQQTVNIDPWAPADAIITITFAKSKNQGGGQPEEGDDFGPALLSGGTSTELAETDFDATNLALAYASRSTIFVQYDATSTGAPTVGNTKEQDGRVPIFAARSQFTFTRIARTDPSGRSRDYASKTNSGAFFGMAANTVLCTAYVFDQQLDGFYRESISFAYDPDTKWKQYARYTDPETGEFPHLITTQIAANNGIKEITVQGAADFDDLELVLYVP